MIKKFKDLSPYTKSSIILITLLLIGIILRWSHIKDAAKRGFNFFSSDSEQVDSTSSKP